MFDNVPTGYSFKADDKQISTQEPDILEESYSKAKREFCNRDQLLDILQAIIEALPACHDDRNRDAIYREYETFQKCAACNKSDEVVRQSFIDAAGSIISQWKRDKRRAETVGIANSMTKEMTTCGKYSCQREEQCDDCWMIDHLQECTGCEYYDHPTTAN